MTASDHDRIYDETRERICALAGADPAAADRRVPACPEWRVKDVVAHLAGLAADWRAGNLTTYGTDEWTAAQVEERRERGLAEVVAEWAEHAAAIAPALADPAAAGVPTYMPAVVITDLAAHEHDIRHALDRPGARDSQAVQVGLGSHVGGLRLHFGGLGLPPLRVVAEGWREWMVGRGEPVATVRGSAFELFRATGGRRTPEQVRALDWEGDAEPFVADFLQRPYGWPDTAIDE